MEAKKKLLNLNLVLLLFALIPLITGAIAFTIISANIMVKNLETSTYEELVTACTGLQKYYEYDLVNDNDLTDGFISYDHSYIDDMQQTGIDFTIFKYDERFMTTIFDKNTGNRIEGTKASPEVWEAVSAGKDFYSSDIVINDIDYYVYYLPMKNGNGEVVGMAFAGKQAIPIQHAEHNIISIVIGVSLGILIFYLLISLWIAKKMSTPLKKVAVGIESLSNGDTNTHIEAHSIIKETNMLLDSSHKLSAVLNGSIAKIRDSASTLASTVQQTSALANDTSSATKEISDSMENLSQATFSMAENVQNIANEMNDMNVIMGDTTQSVNKLSSSASTMNDANKEAAECIESVVESSVKSSEAIDGIISKINETNNSIVKIEEMVGLINDIASQTNLLALNASIEAARAGEAGRGFAVVADEIGKLAAQSNESADEIKNIVSAIAVQSKECVDQTGSVKKYIDEEKELLSTTQDKFTLLDANIKASVEEISAVTDVTRKLESIKETITNAVSDLSAISEETSATNEEVTASTESVLSNIEEVSAETTTLNDLATDLMQAVEYFK